MEVCYGPDQLFLGSVEVEGARSPRFVQDYLMKRFVAREAHEESNLAGPDRRHRGRGFLGNTLTQTIRPLLQQGQISIGRPVSCSYSVFQSTASTVGAGILRSFRHFASLARRCLFARKPPYLMRTSPGGRTCCRKRRMNSCGSRVIVLCSSFR